MLLLLFNVNNNYTFYIISILVILIGINFSLNKVVNISLCSCLSSVDTLLISAGNTFAGFYVSIFFLLAIYYIQSKLILSLFNIIITFIYMIPN